MTIAVRPPEVEINPEPTTTIKPSEAIRLGRLTVPNGTAGVTYMERPDGTAVACSMGAMAVGYGMDMKFKGAARYWPEAFEAQYKVPIPTLCSDCGFSVLPPVAFITHTFDHHVARDFNEPCLTEQDIIDHLASNGL